MNTHLRANLWLIFFTIGLSAIAYPLVVLAFGQFFFHDKAEGSLLYDKSGNVVGSSLIAQPFTGDEYFHPRPSSVSYNAAATGGSNWAANNYLLRNRVACALGPIVKYASGDKKGQLAAPDIEAWFRKDQFDGKPGIVAQWADAHNSVAQNWVGTTFDAKNITPQQQYVIDWEAKHSDIVAKFKTDNPDNKDPSPSDLAVVFFDNFSKESPGKFLSAVTKPGPDKKPVTTIEIIAEGSDVQSTFFDMWRQENPKADLEKVPADMVMASGAGVDPHITLQSAIYQLDGVVAKRATAKLPAAELRKKIEDLLKAKATAPLGGVAGVPLINVLEINLALDDRYPTPPESKEPAPAKDADKPEKDAVAPGTEPAPEKDVPAATKAAPPTNDSPPPPKEPTVPAKDPAPPTKVETPPSSPPATPPTKTATPPAPAAATPPARAPASPPAAPTAPSTKATMSPSAVPASSGPTKK